MSKTEDRVCVCGDDFSGTGETFWFHIDDQNVDVSDTCTGGYRGKLRLHISELVHSYRNYKKSRREVVELEIENQILKVENSRIRECNCLSINDDLVKQNNKLKAQYGNCKTAYSELMDDMTEMNGKFDSVSFLNSTNARNEERESLEAKNEDVFRFESLISDESICIRSGGMVEINKKICSGTWDDEVIYIGQLVNEWRELKSTLGYIKASLMIKV